MTHYRLYALTGDGHIQSGHDIEADNDGEAIQLARRDLEQVDIELWCGKRKVAVVPRGGPAIFVDAATSQFNLLRVGEGQRKTA